ncbi:tetratricopeptide repeat protein [Lutibacter citreus]|uniref:tetratricopeptide repeat protein n=1 Tax=Lutibacter citreus TaxID=2138210 RepID=UPI000DBE51E0|nr:tetratricopeptide repeat protein [Lutibacter citreus]
MEELRYIEFDNYLNNELVGEELTSFEKRLQSDADFKQEFEIYKSLNSSLSSKFENEKDEQALRQTLNDLGSKYIKTTKKETKVIPLFNYKKLLVAASIALLIGFFVFKNGNPVYSDFSNHNNLDIVARGDSNNTKSKAEKAFNSKNYIEALKQLTTLSNEHPNDVEIQLYKGISLLELNKYSEADAIFEKISTGSSAFTTKATWYKALNYLKQKKFEDCKRVLKTIPEAAEEYEMAQKLLGEL